MQPATERSRTIRAALLDVESRWANRPQVHPADEDYNLLYMDVYDAFAGEFFKETTLTNELLEVTIPELVAETVVDRRWNEFASVEVAPERSAGRDRKLGKYWIASGDFAYIVRRLRPAISKWKAAELRRPSTSPHLPTFDFKTGDRKELYQVIGSPNQQEFADFCKVKKQQLHDWLHAGKHRVGGPIDAAIRTGALHWWMRP